MGRPEEIATVALFLASGEASFVNGVELSVGGGFSPSESAVTKSRLVPADRARSGTWPCHARFAEVVRPVDCDSSRDTPLTSVGAGPALLGARRNIESPKKSSAGGLAR